MTTQTRPRPTAAADRGSQQEDAGVTTTDEPGARATLGACFLGMFVVTLDAVVVNVALPHIRADLGGGMAGLQWVVDGYTLLVAALLLSAGALSDRIGAKRAFAVGMAGFGLASVACGLAPTLPLLVAARVLQGGTAALLMPTSMALIGQAYHDPVAKARAVGMWALGGAVASSAGPVLGGALAMLHWRSIFLVNVPVAVIALLLLRRTPASPVTRHPYDVPGLVLAVVAIGSLTWAAIESGGQGPTAAPVLAAAAVAVLASAAFLAVERRRAHPMLPLELFRSAQVRAATILGFVFMACYYGTPFVLSLELQQARGLSSVATGVAFLPMMLIGLVLTPYSARLVERFGRRPVVAAGLTIMAAGLIGLALVGTTAPTPVVSALLLLVGIGGPTVMPPVTATMLNAVPGPQSGTASGVVNTSRQVGGRWRWRCSAPCWPRRPSSRGGVRVSMFLAAALTVAALGGVRSLGSLER